MRALTGVSPWAVAIGAAAMVAAGVAGCVSERVSGSSQTIEGECRLPLGEGVAGSTVVLIKDFSFQPATVRVRRGERVTWLNCETQESGIHTSTADNGAWSSPLIDRGQIYTRTFDAAGSFPYHCTPHPGMQATVIVE